MPDERNWTSWLAWSPWLPWWSDLYTGPSGQVKANVWLLDCRKEDWCYRWRGLALDRTGLLLAVRADRFPFLFFSCQNWFPMQSGGKESSSNSFLKPIVHCIHLLRNLVAGVEATCKCGITRKVVFSPLWTGATILRPSSRMHVVCPSCIMLRSCDSKKWYLRTYRQTALKNLLNVLMMIEHD